MSHTNPSTDVVIDIETYQDIPPEVLKARVSKIKAPKGWKDPEKIEAHRLQKQAEIREKAALSPITGRVVAVGLGLRRNGSGWEFGCFVDRNNDEAGLLTEVDRALFEIDHGHLITFGGSRFDLPFLVARAMRHRMPLRYRWPVVRYSKRHIDLRELLGEGSLSEWAALVLGQEKNGNGSDVAGLVEGEKWDELRAYCLGDVRITAKLFDAYEQCAWLDRR